jgi:hypothetical protein
MRRHQADQPLVALALAAWIPHASIIVRHDDDVKRLRLRLLVEDRSAQAKTRWG